jgi:uronate dehydrogenase
MKIVLLTGAAGDVATHLRRELAGRYSFRLSDLQAIRRLGTGETFLRADLGSLPQLLKATKGVDAIVHLGGMRTEAPWPTILRSNLLGVYNLFEAARRNRVKRIVFASSNHATGFYRRDQIIDDGVYPRPDSRYGLSKVFGEQVGFLYAQKAGMEVFNIRIGNVTPAPRDKRRLSNWLSPRDCAQLVAIGLDHPDIQFEIVYGVSGNTRSFYDNSNAHRLGYRPQDNSEPFAAGILKREPPPLDARVEVYQGGAFVLAGDTVPGDEPPPVPRARGKKGTAKSKAKGTLRKATRRKR